MRTTASLALLHAGILFLAGCSKGGDQTGHTGASLEEASKSSPKSQPGSWISEPPDYARDAEGTVVSNREYWQTQATVLPMAIRRLETVTFLKLTEDEASYFAGPHYQRQPGTDPYLVRAVFWNYTGDFALLLKDGSLYVGHHSLGHLNGETKLPLVVNLKSAPKQVYTHMGAAL